jgi:hypothetical protein
MDYKQKYLKYKQKYISLKQTYGGGHDDQQKKQEEQKKQEHQKKLHEYQPHQLIIDGHDESDDEPEFIAAAAPAPAAPPVIPVPAPAPIPIAPPALVPIPGPFAGHVPVVVPEIHIEQDEDTINIINERIINYRALQLQNPMAPPQLVRNLSQVMCINARDLMPQNGDSVVFISENAMPNGVRRNYLVRLDNEYYRVDLTVGQNDNITVSQYFFD